MKTSNIIWFLFEEKKAFHETYHKNTIYCAIKLNKCSLVRYLWKIIAIILHSRFVHHMSIKHETTLKRLNHEKRRRYGGRGGIQLPLERLPDSSVSSLIRAGNSGRTSGHQKLVPTSPWIDSCPIWWLNSEGWLSTLCCWEAAVHILDKSMKKMDVKVMMIIEG